jgi:hypothetical protein
MYRCTAAFGCSDVSRAGLDTAATAAPPAPRGMASSLAPRFVVEGGSLSGSSRTPLVPAIRWRATTAAQARVHSFSLSRTVAASARGGGRLDRETQRAPRRVFDQPRSQPSGTVRCPRPEYHRGWRWRRFPRGKEQIRTFTVGNGCIWSVNVMHFEGQAMRLATCTAATQIPRKQRRIDSGRAEADRRA